MNTIAQVKPRRLQIAMVTAFAFVAAAVGGNAAAADATATATTTVVAPINITKAVDLSFGSIAAAATAGTVSVGTGGTRTVSGGVIAAGGTPAAAKFDITGEGNLAYGITYASGVQLIGPGAPMALTQVSDLAGDGSGNTLVASGQLVAGVQSLWIGGTLNVGAGQVAGNYTGNITATVNYQ